MRLKSKRVGLMMLSAVILSLSAAAFMVYAANDSWEDHASTSWYNEDYKTFTIDTEEKLAGVAKLVNNGVTDFDKKVLEVSANLDLSAHKWEPVGSASHPFRGTLVGKAGQMMNLSGLTIASSSKQAGLFGYLSGATVGGFHVLGNIQINSTEGVQVGAIAGFMDQNSIVYNIRNEASIRVTSTKEAYVGGVVGAGSGELSDIVNQAGVTLNGSTTGVVGGIAAASTGGSGLSLKKIENTGAVTVTGSVYQANVGGILGLANASLSMKDQNTLITNSALITATNNTSSVIGGIVGRVETGAVVTFSNLTSNKGNISVLAPGSKGSFVGGLVGSFEHDMLLDVPFTQTGTITNQAGSSIFTGGVTGIVYGDFTLGQNFVNTVPIIVNGDSELYTGGIVGKAGGTVTFTNTVQNKASLQVSGTGDQVFTGGLVGFAGNRLLFNSTVKDAYINSGQITVSGASEIYTGGIVANKAYVKAANNVLSKGDITATGAQKLYTGGFVGIVSGSDTNMSSESFSNKITVTASSLGEDSAVYTGGIVGYYGVNGTLASPAFAGQLTVTGGKGASTGGAAGYVSGGTITGATIGGTSASFAKLVSDGRVGGIAGYLDGTAAASSVRFTAIQSSGASGFAGGAAGQAKGTVTGVTVGLAEAENNDSAAIRVTAGNTAAGGIVGADDGALLIANSTVNKMTITAESGADRVRIGGVAGVASASVTSGQAIVVHNVALTTQGAESLVGGAVGDNGALLTGLVVNNGTIETRGAASAIGGIAGFTRGDILNPRVYAEEGGILKFTANGKDSAVGGIVGIAEDSVIRGNGQDGNVTGVAITTSSTASGAQVGGIVGRSNKASLQNIVAESPVLTVYGVGTQAGGLAGQMKDASITQSYALGVLPDYMLLSVYGSDSHAGGLVGQAERISVTGNAVKNNVENLSLVVDSLASGVHAGGFVGTNIESKVEKVFGAFISLTPKGQRSVVGGMTGYNKGAETAVLNLNFIESLAINAAGTAVSSTIGGMIGLNDARSGQADAAVIEKAVSTVQNSRVLGKIIVHAQSAITGGMIGENRSILANNSIAEKLPVTSDGNNGVVGGLVGRNTGTIYYTYSNALLSVSGASTVAGGLAGENNGNVIASYIETDLTGNAVGTSGNYALLGGLVGKNNGTVDKSFTAAKVTANGANTYAGGLIGGNTGTMINTYSAKEVTANAKDAYAGGLIGLMKAGSVKGSYSAGQVNGNNGALAGGFAGYYDNVSRDLIDNSYYVKDAKLAINSDRLDFGGGTYDELKASSRLSPILAASLANRETFPVESKWTFSDTAWRFGSLNAVYQYPELNLSANTGGTPGGSNGGSGNEVNMNINWYTKKPSALRFVIQTEADLAGLAGIVNGTITGMEPFDFKGREIDLTAPIRLQSNQWVPIGNKEQTAFEGLFRGNQLLISGLQVTANSYAGLFGVIGQYATVQDMKIEPISVEGNQYVGALAGYNKGIVTQIQVTLPKQAKVANGTFVGGLAGVNAGSIAQASVQGSMIGNGTALGGIAGNNLSAASITQSFSYSDLWVSSGAPHAGGIAGENHGMIADSYNSGTVTASGMTLSRAGGIVGYGPEGSIEDSMNSGQISANVNGALAKGQTFFGGIAGQLGQRATLRNNIFDEQMLQLKTAYYSEAGNRMPTEVNKATAMKTADFVKADLPAGLDRSVWKAKAGYYPQLAVFNGTTESDLSTAAVILNADDNAYRTVRYYYTQTMDPTLNWATQTSSEQTLLTVSKNGKNRTIAINKKPVLYAETAGKPTGTDPADFKDKFDVTLATTEPDGIIYYTVDGRDPTVNSLVYGQSITLDRTTTIKAIAFVEGKNNSEIFAATYKKMIAGGGGGGFFPPVGTTVEVLVNGKAESAGSETTSVNGSVITSTIVLNEQVLAKLLEQQGEKSEIKIQFANRADITIGELSADFIKKMESKKATLIVDTGKASYSIPAQQFNVKAIAEKLGPGAALKDIKVRIEMRAAAPELAKRLQSSAAAGGYTLLTSPVSFKATYTYGENTYEVGNFDTYVERAIILPDEAAASKLSTAIVVDQEGTVRHVPTQIRQVGGKSYAIIRTQASSGMYALIASPTSFADVAAHWAKDTINDLGARLILGGVSEELFEPDRDITRAEFATIMVKALELKADAGNMPFGDVHDSDWYAPYIQAAQQHGLISGYEDGTFGSLDAISREQAMTIIARAMQLTGLGATLATSETDQQLAGFADAPGAAEYARSGIAASLKMGLVSGRSEAELAPSANMTRAEVAAIIRRLLQKSGLI
ncbi:S-layer homology domain-containing protein [Paenibacillus sp. HWE-109]|uniref:S-layer homology domain-containing protein n=1 Tax=Paenibacillus sp. HWE-109 TaxID=1306526 RepID=UPI001EE0B9DB|nr:S-layer homology domain-containing protein [Paenibacillus sp. HWE-109]UKS27101.1 S-layer homology domain-containing protein [Paenibacillus sp. HWE-109]